MTKAHRLIPRKKVLSQDVSGVPLNFLLGASDASLDSYELARLAAIADLRREIHERLDMLNQEMALASLVRWFRGQDRNALKHAIENEETPLEWANRMIRDGQRSEEELLPLPKLPPGSAHLAASVRYQQRNIAEGKCRSCPRPLAHNSVEFCEEHLAKHRARQQRDKGLSTPGSREYLYSGEVSEDGRGRARGNLERLALEREKKTRAVLAERGIPPESNPAVSLKACIEALLKHMPQTEADALTQAQLFEKAGVVTKTTGQRALQQLIYTGEIQRIGKGGPLDLYRYFAASAEQPKRRVSSKSKSAQNKMLIQTLRGEDPGAEQ